MSLATANDRNPIYRLRHDVYAEELGQHATNHDGLLKDSLDEFNEYVVLFDGATLIGCLSLTPPGHGHFSVDRYVAREKWPFAESATLYEIRLLTVRHSARKSLATAILLYAGFRTLETRGAERIIGMGRRELMDFYRSLGFRQLSEAIPSGAQHFHFMSATIADLRKGTERHRALVNRLTRHVDWQLPQPMTSEVCYHGGAFFEAIGDTFENLDRHREVINADVMDAWFPPAPAVIETLQSELPWIIRTSPPTQMRGYLLEIAKHRGLHPDALVPGAGSSALIFLALRHWLTSRSKVLLLHPSYGEYSFLLDQIGCRVDHIELSGDGSYQWDPRQLTERYRENYDMIVLVNPNNPTGAHIARARLEPILRSAPLGTRIWIDEAYVDYVGEGESLEQFAASRTNVVVCKSLSKVYALSGLRAAYLCTNPLDAGELRQLTPPWAVSLPAQIAGVRALQSAVYYGGCYRETHRLREEFAAELRRNLDVPIFSGAINSVLLDLPAGISAEEVAVNCRENGLYVRTFASQGPAASRWVRVAVKDAATNQRMVGILREAVRSASRAVGSKAVSA